MNESQMVLRLTLPAPPLLLRLTEGERTPRFSFSRSEASRLEESFLDTIRVGTEHFAQAARLMWENPLNDF